MKKITIFTPTYNRKNKLIRLYQSLVAQTSRDFVWIIVDDGSKDGTQVLVNEWIQDNQIDIRYYWQENSGKSMAHNKGAELADTELFTCVDSDDYLEENAISCMIEEWNRMKRPDCIGMIAYRRYADGSSLTKLKDENITYATLSQLYNNYGLTGDTMLIYKTSIIQKYRFPQIEGEKFVPEAYLYDLLDQEGKLLVIRRGIYIGEYLDDGYTANMHSVLLRNNKGYLAFLKQRLHLDQSIKSKFFNSARYDGISIAVRQKKIIRNAVYPVWAVLAFPLGVCIWAKNYRGR